MSLQFPYKVVLDDGNYDSFGRQQIANAISLYDGQFTYDLQPLLMEQVTAESGATITHDTVNRAALMTFATTPENGAAYMQQYKYNHYQPGKAQQANITFNFVEAVADVQKFARYGDEDNSIEFVLDDLGPRFRIRSGTDNANESARQNEWNMDRLDGTGPSKLMLDMATTQIFWLDLQALYVGIVKVGFNIGGKNILCHEFRHSNVSNHPYIQSANLPIACGMKCFAEASTTMYFYCAAVASSGGQEESLAYLFSAQGTVTAADGADTHILSIQPALQFNSFVNRTEFVLDSVDIVVTGANPVLWKLCVGQALTTTTATAVNSFSAIDTVAGTLSGSPSIVIAQGYCAATVQTKQAISRSVKLKYPITLDAAGAVRALGRLTVLVQGIGGTSATRAILNWREVR